MDVAADVDVSADSAVDAAADTAIEVDVDADSASVATGFATASHASATMDVDADASASIAAEADADAGAAAAADLSAAEDGSVRDNLKKVEGIGPKIESLFNTAGIYTFTKLANTDVAVLKQILVDAGSRYNRHDPGTWPEQAALAARGAWDALEKLQDELDGGRRV